jgi:hypothetical protein
MKLVPFVLAAVSFTMIAHAQAFPTPEEFCAKNPDAGSCKDGKPIDMSMDAMEKAIANNPMNQFCANNPKIAGCSESGKAATPTHSIAAPARVRPRPAATRAPASSAVNVERSAAAPKTAQASSGKIVIEGLDDGPREVPLNPAQ